MKAKLTIQYNILILSFRNHEILAVCGYDKKPTLLNIDAYLTGYIGVHKNKAVYAKVEKIYRLIED